MADPVVTVCMPSYNSQRYIAEAISSLRAQTFDDWELLVIDGGSKDRTLEIVGSFHDPRIRAIYGGQYFRAVNIGLDEAKGGFIMRLDSDDIYHPRKLEEEVMAFREHPEAAATFTDGWLMDENGKVVMLSRRCKRMIGGDDVFRSLLHMNFIMHGGMALRRSKLGSMKFDGENRSAEDWDLWIRLARRYPFHHICEPLYYYRMNPWSMTQVWDVPKRAWEYEKMFLRWFRMFPDLSPTELAILIHTCYYVPTWQLLAGTWGRWVGLSLTKRIRRMAG